MKNYRTSVWLSGTMKGTTMASCSETPGGRENISGNIPRAVTNCPERKDLKPGPVTHHARADRLPVLILRVKDNLYHRWSVHTFCGGFMEGDPVLELTDTDWEKLVEKSDLPVLVMFYSPTCPYCRTMEPYFRGYAREYEGIVSFGRLNITGNRWTAERYGILSTPTFVMFCTGKPFQVVVGGVYPALLKRMVEESLASGTDCMKHSTTINYDISGYG
jgi:thioredoxin 1